MAYATKGLGMLRNVGTALKRSPESRQCIDEQKAMGKSGREARQVCRDRYGSRLGNAGRKLGILPQEAKGVNVSQFAQDQFKRSIPNKLGMTSEQIVFPSGSTTARKGGFNPIFLLFAIPFIPAVRKFLGF